jgi:hypothetical protein
MKWFTIGVVLTLSHTAAAAMIETEIHLNADGFQFNNFDFSGNLINGAVSGIGESAQGSASLGALGASSTATNAGDDSAHVDFIDTLTFIGAGSISVFQNLSGVLEPNGMGTMGSGQVAAVMSLTGNGFLGISSTHLIKASAPGGVFADNDQGPLTVPVTSGQILTLLASLQTDVSGSFIANYGSTDHVYITVLTPGLQVVSAGGHDYSPQAPAPGPSSPEPGSLSLVGAGLAMWWASRRRQRVPR